MATIYSDNTGEIIRHLQGDEIQPLAGPPDEYESSLEFDPMVNLELVEGLLTDVNSYRLIAGVLTRNGRPVVVNPHSSEYRRRKGSREGRRDLAEQMDNTIDELKLGIDGWDGLTSGQRSLILKRTVTAVYHLLRYVRSEIKAIQ